MRGHHLRPLLVSALLTSLACSRPSEPEVSEPALLRLVEVLTEDHIVTSPLLASRAELLPDVPEGLAVFPLMNLTWAQSDFGGPPGTPTANRAVGDEDMAIFRHAAPSLHITAETPRNANIGLKPLPIEPSTTYTFIGYVRVEDVVPHEDSASGIFLLEERDLFGRPTWFRSSPHQGTSDTWHREVVTFTTSSKANRLVVHGCLGANGYASGTAWFDDMVLIRHSDQEALPEDVLDDLVAMAIAQPWRFETVLPVEGALGRDRGWRTDGALAFKSKLRIGSDVRSALVAPVPTTFSIPFHGSEPMVLDVGLGVRQLVDLPAGSGITFEIALVQENEPTRILLSEYVTRPDEGADWRPGWLDRRIPITTDSPGPVQLVLRTTAPDDLFLAPAAWGNPILRPEVQRNDSPRRVILVSIDTLRADHLGCYGHEHDTSPFLDSLAERGTLFERVHASAPFTLSSHITMLTGLHPTSHHVFVETSRRMDSRITTLGEVFQDAGFVTAGVHGGGLVDPTYGFSEGFDVYRAGVDFGTVLDRAAQMMIENRDQDTFLFVHTYNVHAPYEERPESLAAFESPYAELKRQLTTRIDMDMLGSVSYLGQYTALDRAFPDRELETVRLLYDGEIRETDHLLGEFFARLESEGLLENTLIVVTSDHGDEFKEHGGLLHGHSLHDEVVHVPLIMAGPGVPVGLRVTAPVGIVDVTPTILDLVGLAGGDDSDGRSLKSLLDDPSGPPVTLFASLVTPEKQRFTVLHDNHRYFYDALSGTERLYDLTSDPGERIDIAAGSDLELYRDHLREQLAQLPGLHLTFRNNGRYKTLSGSAHVRGHRPEVRQFFPRAEDRVDFDPETGVLTFEVDLSGELAWLNLEYGPSAELVDLKLALDDLPVMPGQVRVAGAEPPPSFEGGRFAVPLTGISAEHDRDEIAQGLGLHLWAVTNDAPEADQLDEEQVQRLRELGYLK